MSSLAYTEQFKTFKVTKLAESYSMFREFSRNMQIIHTLCRLLLIKLKTFPRRGDLQIASDSESLPKDQGPQLDDFRRV